jgi:uncharacterized protein (TIGR00645 family)
MEYIQNRIPSIIFASRWLQAPLYFGLMAVLAVYVYEFGVSLSHLISNAKNLNETTIMLHALDLIDVVMIANLLIMVIVGGYETFVSRLNLRQHPDNPDWLDEVNAGTLKIKLALALVSISSIHLLRTFIDPGTKDNFNIMWQVIIHISLVLSAIGIAYTDKMMIHKPKKSP